ncbi:uncharacterized protein [Rhodnius prolixus]|uniref:uncharacterized protein n=1 Tax=Rhodnius prolixus TaxID=13249 RepID=UPI003D18C7C6
MSKLNQSITGGSNTMYALIQLSILTTIFNICSAAPTCRLGQDLLNSLVNAENKDAEDFGVEYGFGLVGDVPSILDKHNLTAKEFQDCLQNYFETSPTKMDKTKSPPPSVSLHYVRPAKLGRPPELPVPVPKDEDYLPGEEGYTTYINPHNFQVGAEENPMDRTEDESLEEVADGLAEELLANIDE